MTGSNRIEEVDISKGIGMVLVITGHLCVSASLRNFIYSFHMPLFFIEKVRNNNENNITYHGCWYR